MATVQSYRPPQGPLAQGPKSFAELIGGLVVLGGIGVLIYVAFQTPLLLSLVGNLFAGIFAAPVLPFGDCLLSLAVGALAGALTVWIRMRFRKRVAEELVGAVVSPEMVTVGQVGWAATVFSIAIGLGSGLVAARLGLLDWSGHSSVLVEPLLVAAGLWGGGAGPGAGGGGGDVLISLLAILLVILALTLVFAFGITTVYAAAAKSLVTGASQGIGRAFGMGIVLMLTRLRTTIVKEEALRGPPGRLGFDPACEHFVQSGRSGSGPEERREVAGRYLDWVRAQGITPTADSIRDPVGAYCAQSARRRDYEGHLARTAHIAKKPIEPGWEEQKPLRVARAIAREAQEREEQILRDFADEIPWKIREREPARMMGTTDGAPVFDGSRETLLHQRWFLRSLQTGAREGAIVGLLSGLFALGASVLLK